MSPDDTTAGTPEGPEAEVLSDLAEEILVALSEVAGSARAALGSTAAGISTSALVNPSNLMVGESRPERRMAEDLAQLRVALRRLLIEPFVARVEVDWGAGGGVQTFYFPRGSAAGLGPVAGAHFVTSGANLGRLADHEAGDVARIFVKGGERVGRIVSRTVVDPSQRGELWDAFASEFELMPWGEVLQRLRNRSLRSFAEAAKSAGVEDIVGALWREAAEAEAGRSRLRRKVVDRIALRDRPVLNKFQGDIFRLPLDNQVLLLGPPGSGKTTTLIRRLAQKRTPDALTEGEEALVSSYVRENLVRPNSWAMFAPSELLKQYLGHAFNKAGVPDAGNVRTWDKERHDLARNVLNILRNGNTGRFQFDSAVSLLADPSSAGIAKMHDDFSGYIADHGITSFKASLETLLKSDDEKVRQSVLNLRRRLGASTEVDLRDLFRLVDNVEELQVQVRRLNDEISAELTKMANLLLNTNKGLLDEIAAALPAIRAAEDDGDDDEADEDPRVGPSGNARIEALSVLMASFRNWARSLAEGRGTVRGQSGRAIEILGARLPPARHLAETGATISLVSHLRTLIQAPRRLVSGIPAMYRRYRRESAKDARHFAAGAAMQEAINRNRIGPDEVDVLILVMMRNARQIIRAAGREGLESATQHEWLEGIKRRYLMQVFVDEATDLSAVQLACTVELANPALRSWFACGDLRQRITSNGIRDTAELTWLDRTTGSRIDVRQIDIGYRQSRRLRELSDALAFLLGPGPGVTKPPRADDDDDVWPLLGENLSAEDAASWLAERIHEVEVALGGLPSIAVFVDGDGSVDRLVGSARARLAERNIPLVGCKEGSEIGDARAVRVFDIRHIKGMEFEAVFFIDVDRLAQRMPDLFQRFLYVGLTRAATYLGLTCAGSLPPELETLRPRFGTGGWSDS
jgi:hypothetical protein